MNKLVLYIMEVCSKAMARETILNDPVASGNRWVTRHSVEVPIHEEAIIHLSDAVNQHERTIESLKKEISDNEAESLACLLEQANEIVNLSEKIELILAKKNEE